ncbi:unnamed protein product [Alopecurus aequalis]
METDSEMTEEVGRKREIHNGSEMAWGRRTSRKITPTENSSGLEQMDASDEMYALFKEEEEFYVKRVKRLAAKWNAENPDATPLVLEALTEQQLASLVQEDLARGSVDAEAFIAREAEEMARMEEEEMARRDPNQDDDDRDYQEYRGHWEWKTAKEFGSFEDRTRIPAMCFTDEPVPPRTIYLPTMQIFSVKVDEVDGDLHWPLDVFGVVAVRDDIDYNRNIIFERKRDNCQTLSEQVKHTNESEDKDLSLIATRYKCCESIDYQAGQYTPRSCVSSQKFKSKLSTLELTCGIVVPSIEATISVRVVEGSWTDGFSGRFTACTANFSHMKVSLLEFRDGNVPVFAVDGTIELSRRVVPVELSGELRICAALWRGSNKVEHEVFFEPLKSGRSSRFFFVDSCKMEVTVGWSCVPLGYPTARIASINGDSSKVG